MTRDRGDRIHASGNPRDSLRGVRDGRRDRRRVAGHRLRLQSVASGLLGEASFEGGAATAALGLLLHFLIAISMSAAYYLVARRWPPLRDHAVLCGAAYGLVLYAVMNCVIVPLSAAGPGSRHPLWVGLTIAVHVFLIGIPIALFTRRALRA